jgi:hypothetical protein
MLGTRNQDTEATTKAAIENLAAVLGQIDAYLGDPAVRARTKGEAMTERQRRDDGGNLPDLYAEMLDRVIDPA